MSDDEYLYISMPSIPMTGTTPMRRREHNRQENMFVKDEAGTADGDNVGHDVELLHTSLYTEKSLHCTQRSFHAQTHLHTKIVTVFTHRSFHTKKLLC